MVKNEVIGVFDSGVGGLTVARSIYDNFNFKDLIYFGDLAHLPYGDKSEAAIQAYSVRIADFLQKKGCTTIVIACNSASSAAYTLLKEYFKGKIRIINVIDPMVKYIHSRYEGHHIGLLGTKRTIDSGIYESRLRELSEKTILHGLATPLLVPMIEEGFIGGSVSKKILKKYLSFEPFSDISAMILGCTHYPLIRSQISAYFNNKIEVVDSTRVIADYLKDMLPPKDDSRVGKTHFFVSDYTRSFEKSSKYFFGKEVKLELCNIWPD